MIGFTKAETERIWLFFAPFVCLAAAASARTSGCARCWPRSPSRRSPGSSSSTRSGDSGGGERGLVGRPHHHDLTRRVLEQPRHLGGAQPVGVGRGGRDDDAVIAFVGEQLAQRMADRAAAADPPVDRHVLLAARCSIASCSSNAWPQARGIGVSSGSDIGTGAR